MVWGFWGSTLQSGSSQTSAAFWLGEVMFRDLSLLHFRCLSIVSPDSTQLSAFMLISKSMAVSLPTPLCLNVCSFSHQATYHGSLCFRLLSGKLCTHQWYCILIQKTLPHVAVSVLWCFLVLTCCFREKPSNYKYGVRIDFMGNMHCVHLLTRKVF